MVALTLQTCLWLGVAGLLYLVAVGLVVAFIRVASKPWPPKE